MRSGRNTFLAGVAALALVAGAGLTSAQAAPDQQDHKGATTVKEPNTAASPMKANPMKASPMKGSAAARQPRTNRSAQDEKRGAPGGNHAAEISKKSGMTAQAHHRAAGTAEARHHRTGRTAEEHHRMRNRATASRENRGYNGEAGRRAEARGRANGANTAARERSNDERMRGLQANASGANMQFSDQQRTEIRNTVIDAAGAPRVDHVDFNVAVGTAVPRGGITVVPVPEMLVRIDPAWRGLRYFVFEDELVIVNPRTMRIVAVVMV